MTYGHDGLRHADSNPSTTARDKGPTEPWRALDADRRLAIIEQALGNRRLAA